MTRELPKNYEPLEAERRITRRWLEADAFAAVPDGRGEDQRYVIMMPLPNVTGALHMGHAIDNVMQDLLIRWHRMQGKNALWQPGTDHAGHRHPGGGGEAPVRAGGEDPPRRRDGKRWWSGSGPGRTSTRQRIVQQQQEMGCSCDWKRQRFTMDAVCSRGGAPRPSSSLFRGRADLPWRSAGELGLQRCRRRCQRRRGLSRDRRRAISGISAIPWWIRKPGGTGPRHRGDHPAGDHARRYRGRLCIPIPEESPGGAHRRAEAEGGRRSRQGEGGSRRRARPARGAQGNTPDRCWRCSGDDGPGRAQSALLPLVEPGDAPHPGRVGQAGARLRVREDHPRTRSQRLRRLGPVTRDEIGHHQHPEAGRQLEQANAGATTQGQDRSRCPQGA